MHTKLTSVAYARKRNNVKIVYQNVLITSSVCGFGHAKVVTQDA